MLLAKRACSGALGTGCVAFEAIITKFGSLFMTSEQT